MGLWLLRIKMQLDQVCRSRVINSSSMAVRIIASLVETHNFHKELNAGFLICDEEHLRSTKPKKTFVNWRSSSRGSLRANELRILYCVLHFSGEGDLFSRSKRERKISVSFERNRSQAEKLLREIYFFYFFFASPPPHFRYGPVK